MKNKNLKAFFNESLLKYSERPALTCLGHTLSYKQLDELSDALASYFYYDLDLKPGDKLAIQLPNLLQYPVVILAAVKVGLVIVNINPLYTKKELLHQLQDSQVKAVVLLSSLTGVLASIIHETEVQHVIVTQVGDLLSPRKRFFVNSILKFKSAFTRSSLKSNSLKFSLSFRKALTIGKNKNINSLPTILLRPDSLAILQYTGGTTGVSKGAMLSHSNLLSNIQQIHLSFKDSLDEGQEVIVAPLPIYHIFCFMVCVLFGFSIGAHLILIPDPRKTGGLISSLKGIPFTFFIGLNTLFNNLNHHKAFKNLDFKHLKFTVSGGMPLLKGTALTWQAITQCKVLEGYGLTEASPVVTLNPYHDPHIGTVGKLLNKTECRFLDDKGLEVKKGQPGELLVRGPQVMLGYWKKPGETAETIDKEGWLHTGDIAIQHDDGYISIVDRIKNMIVVSGFNVYPSELEKEISKHPDIIECAAIGIDDPDTGEAVKLFVVTKNNNLSEEDIQAFAHKTLCSYKIPKQIEFRKNLPKSNVGKILHKDLRD